MPFQDLPRLEWGGMSIRFAIFGIVPIAGYFFYQLATRELAWKKVADKKSLCLLLTFIIGLILLFSNGIDPRPVGFLVWFAFSIIFFLSVIHIDYRGALWGLLGGQIFNSSYILLQNYLYPWIWVPERYFSYFSTGQFRNYGLVGEPSYVAISLIPALVYFHETEIKKRGLLCSVLIVSLFLCFSGIGLISLGVFSLFALFKNWKKFMKLTLPALSVGFFLAFLQNPSYYGVSAKVIPILSCLRSLDARTVQVSSCFEHSSHVEKKAVHRRHGVLGSTNERLTALKRGTHFFIEHPWGVGLGNSKKALIARYYPEGVPAGKHAEGVHNIFQEVAIELGIWGLVTFSLFLFFILWPMWLAGAWTPLMMCVGMLVPMQFAQNINMPGMWITLAVAVGLFNAQRSREGKLATK